MGKIKKIKQARKQLEAQASQERETKQSLWTRNIISILVIGIFAIAIILTKTNSKININNEQTMAIKANIQTNKGNITIELYPDKAPKTVENFTSLAGKGYYNNLIFHRVIDDFMIQAGDPFCSDDNDNTQCGAGGKSTWGASFADEKNDLLVDTGALAMANSGPDTNISQFFIVTGPHQEQLDGKHTVFGKVIEGMGVADAISRADTDDSDKPVEDVKIEKIEIVKL